MAAQQQKFEAGVAKVCELRGVAHATTDLVNESWAALRSGIVVARRMEEVLDAACAEQEMPYLLDFMLQRGAQKKAARGQVKECLRILLARPPWLAAARAEEGLRGRVCEALDGEQDAGLLAQLAVQEAVDDAAAEEGEAGEDAGLEEPRAPEEGSPAAAKPLTIRERFAQGKEVLASFGWEFPLDPTGTRGDEATVGFMLIFDAVTALTTTSGRASIGDEPAAALAGLEEDWASLLQFLVSMYTSGVRRTYSARVRFVAVHLRALAPAFRELAPWASLPWGHLPMPAEEVEAEARALEDFCKRQAEEAENLALAHELQAQEDAEALALEEVRQQLVQEDFALAWKLHEQGRPAQPAAQQPAVQEPGARRRFAGGA